MEQTIDVIVKETVTETVTLDKELAEQVRDLVIMGLNEAKNMLEFGLADQKLAIMKTLLSGATRVLGKDFTSTEQEARFALDRMFSEIRKVKHVESQASIEGTYDPDEGSDDREIPD